jgi:methylated-DNA-[protein]-cysteine S-methyltransferase
MTTPARYALFDTPIGVCGIAWRASGVVGVNLPEGDPAATRARIARRHPGAVETVPPARVHAAIERIVALLSGERADLSAIPLDLAGASSFEQRVYDVARTIAPGTTLTYGEIAARLGEPNAAREVGQAMGRNPCPLIVPCHRVLAAGGALGGFSAHGGVVTKTRLLAIEGAPGNGDLFV